MNLMSNYKPDAHIFSELGINPNHIFQKVSKDETRPLLFFTEEVKECTVFGSIRNRLHLNIRIFD